MKILARTGLLFLAFAIVGACSRPAEQAVDDNATVNRLADRYVATVLARQPEIAYFTGLEAPAHDYLQDNSLSALAEWQAFEDELYAELAQVNPDSLAQREWVMWGALKEALEASRGQRICKAELWQGVNHMFSWHTAIAPLAARQPVETADDKAAALRRWSSLPKLIDTEIANLEKGLAEGYSAPRAVAEAMLQQIERMLTAPVEQSPLYAMAARADDEAFTAELEKLIDGDIRASIQRYRDFLADSYIPQARDELAVTALPDGEACYRAMLRSWTTLDRDPREVYELGERTVKANTEYVLRLGKEWFGLDSIPGIVAHVNKARDNLFDSEEALVAHSRRIVEQAREQSAPMFLEMPAAPVVVEPFPEYQRGSGRSSHYIPPGDADTPGEYRISLDFWQKETVGNAEITAVHEAWPGHHLQISRALELKNQHDLLKLTGNSGYVEGWGRYAEHLAEEAGIYESRYAQISRRLWPARGMVADPGLHLYGWTAEQTADYLAEAGRFSPEESKALITRMAALPGQLTAYDSGALVIFGLREEAESKLGERFNLAEFHERVLENGSLPLWQLQDHVRAWIDEQAGN